MHDSGLRIDIDIWACMSARYSPFSLSVHISSPPPLARTPLGPKQLCNQIVAVEAESSLALAGVELSIGSTEQIPTVRVGTCFSAWGAGDNIIIIIIITIIVIMATTDDV